ncbi:MAG: phosphoribosylglycinamide formyltransferase [Bacteroidota bacterium]
MIRLALFASGGGSNMDAILKAIDAGRLDATPVLVVSDRETAGALDRARKRDLPVAVVPPGDDAAEFGRALLDVLAGAEADTVALAGYLRKIPEPVLWAYPNRVFNVHPSLLPSFGGPGLYGRRVHQAVLDYGCRISGATIHLVEADYDTGPVVLQESVRVLPDDTPETLAARVLAVEHRLYPEALSLLASGRLSVEGRRITITGSDAPNPSIPSPP